MPELPEAFDEVVEIGRGGVGVVYRAHQREFNRTVAVKVITGRFDDDTRRRFEEERHAMGALSSHPNIVTIYGSGTTDGGQPFIVMEYMPGGSLAQQLEHDGALPLPRAIEITKKLAGALEAAHRAGVLHRGVKPESVFVSTYGEPKLGDFGMARLQAGLDASPASGLAHAAPEIIDGHPPTEASDVYSLASSAFAFLTGHAPFVRDTDQSVVPLIARIATEPVPVDELRARGAPDAIGRVLAAAMVKDPAQRTPSAAQLASELAAAAAEREATSESAVTAPVNAPIAVPTATPAVSTTSTSTEVLPAPSQSPARRPPSTDGRSRRGVLIGAGAAALVAIIVGVIALSGGGGDSGDRSSSSTKDGGASAQKSGGIENVPLKPVRAPGLGKLAVDVGVLALNQGECWNDPGGLLTDKLTSIPGVDVVRCTVPHDLEVFAAIAMAGDDGAPYPGDDVMGTFSDSNCGSGFSTFVGRDVTASDLTYYYVYPAEEAWKTGARTVVCSLHRRDLSQLKTSAKDTNL